MPTLELVVQVPEVTVPVWPLPEESLAEVPELSSYFQKAIGEGVDPLALTVSVIGVVWLSVPLVPVTVTVAVPVVAVLLAVSVNVLVVVVDVGLKAAVTPLGRPLAERATDPVKPPVGLTVMVDVPFDPWVTVRLDGLAESV